MEKQTLSNSEKQHNEIGCEYNTSSIPGTNKSKNQKTSGFTIVELLVVIVVIGILAAITIASYIGVTTKANVATMRADLSNASKKIKMYHAQYGVYPTSMPDDGTGKYCPSAPTADTNYCIKPSNGTFTYTVTDPYLDFDLQADSGTLAYHITKDGTATSTNTTAITSIAAITGTAQTNQTLTAGNVTPSGATVNYQWQTATTVDGTYTNIPGATSNTLNLNPSNINKYIRVTVTGTDNYTGTQISAASSQVATDTNWKVIGSQVWATANLNTGTRINGTAAQTNNTTTEKYCYNDTESNCTAYGGLYQWDEAMGYTNDEGTRGICPAGSHIPSDNEWKILEVQLGMTQTQADINGTWRGTDQGTQLKPGGSSGLNMPFAGYRLTDGSFGNMISYTVLWSSSELSGNVWLRDLGAIQATVYRALDTKTYGFSVRCLGD